MFPPCLVRPSHVRFERFLRGLRCILTVECAFVCFVDYGRNPLAGNRQGLPEMRDCTAISGPKVNPRVSKSAQPGKWQR